MLGWRPGGRGPLVPLQEARRQDHENARAAVARRIEERQRHRIPLDDNTVWAAERARLAELGAACAAEDTAKYRKALETALGATRGADEELPPYEPLPKLEGILVRFRTVSRRTWWLTVGRLQDLARRGELLDLGSSGPEERAAFFADREEAHLGLVRHALCELHGVGLGDVDRFTTADDELLPDDVLAALVESGLLLQIFAAARAFQELDPEGRRRFGLEPQPTSQSTNAIGVQSASGPSSDATAAGGNTTAAPRTRAMFAPAAGSSGIHGPPTPSPFTAPLPGALGPMGTS